MSFGRKLERLKGRGKAVAHTAARLDRHVEDIKINQGRMLAALNENRRSTELKDFEFKVFSQWGEDGVIQKLVQSIEIPNKTFIEFGVEDFWEANCRFLMMKDNWSGFVIDGSDQNVQAVQSAYYYWKYDLTAVQSFISRENVQQTLLRSGFESDLGILSVDIDGVDYYVLEAIDAFKPRILICEYNSVFGPERPITIPYDPGFMRSKAHASHLYFGASISALNHLANQRGYTLVGGTSEGVNVFFVRNDVLPDTLAAVTPAEAYVQSRFREGRNGDGTMSFADFEKRRAEIAGMPVFNVVTNETESF